MKPHRATWIVVLVGAAAFAVSGIIAEGTSDVSVSVSLDEAEARVRVAVHGRLAVLADALTFPKSGPGITVDWNEARLRVPGMQEAIPSMRSIDRSRVSLDSSKVIDSGKEVALIYWLRPGLIERGSEDMQRASGLIEDRFGAVDVDMYLPWPLEGSVSFDVSMDEGPVPGGAKLVNRVNRRFLVWHRDSVAIPNGSFQGAYLQGGPPGVSSAMLNVAQKAADAVGAKALPYLIVDSTSPGGYVLISDGVLVVRTTSAGPRARLSLGSAVWRSAWSAFSGIEPTSLSSNLLLHGSDYLGQAAVAEPELLAAVRDRAIERYFHALASAKVRPIPARPIGKENWQLLIPGLLAMMHAGVPDHAWGQGGFLAAMSALSEKEPKQTEDQIAEVLSLHSTSLKSIVSLGLIPALECPAPDGVTLGWFDISEPAESVDVGRNAPALNVLAGAHVNQYLESCGCKTGQAGGLARRATVLEQAGGMCTLRVDCGGFLSGIPLRGLVGQEAAEAGAFLEAFARLPLDAVTVGYQEVCAGLDRVLEPRSPLRRLPLVCANLDPPPEAEPLSPYIVVDLEGMRVAVLGWLGTDVPTEQMLTFQTGLAGWGLNEDLHSIQPEVAAAREVGDVVVLIGDLEHRILREHPEALVGIDLVVTSDGSDPSRRALSKSYHVQRGRPETYLIGQTVVLTVPYGTGSMARFTEVRAGTGPLLVEHVILDDSIPPSPSIEAVIFSLSARFDADVSAIVESSGAGEGYVGADRCRQCHMAEYQDWIGSRHSGAMATLQQVRRDRHASCVACHVTGFGVERGFSSSTLRPKLFGVQCEACHGPGERHAESLKPDDVLRAPPSAICLTCHDAEHSDQFAGRFGEAYRSVSHRGPQR